MIKGWKELEEITGLKDKILQKMIALYGFPKPRKVRDKSISFYCWNTGEVLLWLSRRDKNESTNTRPMGHDFTAR